MRDSHPTPASLSLRAFARALAPLLCAAFAGMAAAAPAEFAYTLNSQSNSISMYTVDTATGQLVDNGSIATGTFPQAIHVVSSGQYAWVTNYLDNNVSIYKVNNTTGKLSEMGRPGYFAPGSFPQAVASAPYGNLVYVTNYWGNSVTAMSFDEDHGPSPLGTVAAGSVPYAVVVHPSGKFAYVTNNGSRSVSAYSIGSTGALASMGPAVAASGEPMGIALHPNGRFAYVANNGSGVLVYAINTSGGALTLAGTASAGTKPQSVTIDPSGSYAYVANFGSSSVSAYRVDSSTGALTALGSYATGRNPSSVVIDPSGQFVYTANTGGGSSTAFRITAGSGALTRLGDVASQTGPISIAVSKATSAPRYAYVTSHYGIDVHDVNASTGSIRPPVIQNLSLGADSGLTLAPSGKFAYAIGPQNLSVLSVAATGRLTVVQALASGGYNYEQIAIAPAGNYAYVTDSGANLVRVFSINADNGSLSEIGNVPTGNGPTSLTFVSSGRFLLVKNQNADTIWTYTVNQTSGALTRSSSLSVDTTNPTENLVPHPAGNLVLLTHNYNTVRAVRSYAVGSNGKLTKVASLTIEGVPHGLMIDPMGSFAYVANHANNTLSTLRVSSTGALSLVGTTSVPPTKNGGQTDARGSVDPSGHFVYIENFLDNALTTYAIDRSTGALTQLSTATLPSSTANIKTALTLRGTLP